MSTAENSLMDSANNIFLSLGDIFDQLSLSQTCNIITPNHSSAFIVERNRLNNDINVYNSLLSQHLIDFKDTEIMLRKMKNDLLNKVAPSSSTVKAEVKEGPSLPLKVEQPVEAAIPSNDAFSVDNNNFYNENFDEFMDFSGDTGGMANFDALGFNSNDNETQKFTDNNDTNGMANLNNVDNMNIDSKQKSNAMDSELADIDNTKNPLDILASMESKKNTAENFGVDNDQDMDQFTTNDDLMGNNPNYLGSDVDLKELLQNSEDADGRIDIPERDINSLFNEIDLLIGNDES
ncbi:hypothetical protein LJB42_001951 [Komagataella kurtzmanii]|nr:hypothetical protein LJB42_001951 [Komagataella kurtzmanii]